MIVLTKIFPTESWESEPVQSHLEPITRADAKRLYKKLWLLDPRKDTEKETALVRRNSNFVIPDSNGDDAKSCEEYFTADFNNRQTTMQLSASQLAQRVIDILKKLVEIENASVLGQTDQHSVTMCCLNFGLDTLSHLHEQFVFNEADQTVIKMNVLELTFLCFNNLVNRDGKSIEKVFKKLFHLLEISDSDELTCGLILNILTILNNLCVKKSIQKTENLSMFVLCNHLIVRRMQMISCHKDLLHCVQLCLVKIISNVEIAHELRICDTKKTKRRKKKEFLAHHDSLSDVCIFEKLLIESSFPLIKSFANLKTILAHLCAKGICCCNGNIETIRIFMKPSTIPKKMLDLIEEKIIKPMFEKSKICIFCNDKINSDVFKSEYFRLLRSELDRRQGWELHALLSHLNNIQKLISGEFLHAFLFEVIVPKFEEEKIKYMISAEENFECKLIIISCLNILNGSIKEESSITRFFTASMIQHLKDCSLIPAMATNACQLLKLAIDNIKIIGNNEDQRKNLAKVIKNILFSNVLYLTHELMEIYGQIDIPISTRRDVIQKPLEKSGEDFEIVEEQIVAVKEPLSDLDMLLLNTIHWNILCDLIAKDPAFQLDFVANIYNNFHGNILFTIAYNALNSILLKKELKALQLHVITPQPRMSSEDLPKIFERCEALTPVVISVYDESYEKTIARSYQLCQISQSFFDKLRRSEECSSIYRVPRAKDSNFRSFVHKNIFLPDNVCGDPERKQQIVEEHLYSYQNWLNQIWIGIFEGKTLRDRIIKVVNKFVRVEEEIKAIHRVNTIREITGKRGIKYLSSIARNCFDICWRLSASDNISFSKFNPKLNTRRFLSASSFS